MDRSTMGKQTTLVDFGLTPAPKVKNPKWQRYLAIRLRKCPICGARMRIDYEPDYDEETGEEFYWKVLYCPRCGYQVDLA